MEFVVRLERDTNDTYLATSPDIPEFASVGDTQDEALANSIDGFLTALQIYVGSRRAIPAPRKAKKGEFVVRLPAQAAAKAILHNEMVAQGVRKAQLGRKLDILGPQVDRLLDMRHSSKLEALEEAIEAMGRHLEVCVA